jgi:hypothetical protein
MPALVAEIEAGLPALQRDLHALRDGLDGYPDPPPASRVTRRERVNQAIIMGIDKYTGLQGPILAIMAEPEKCDSNCDGLAERTGAANRREQTAAFERGTPNARVVRLAGARHNIFGSNEDDVVREMTAFMDGLGAQK